MKPWIGPIVLVNLIAACQPQAAHPAHAPSWAPFRPVAAARPGLEHLDVRLVTRPGGPTLRTVNEQTDWQDRAAKTAIPAVVRGEGLVGAEPNAELTIRGHSTRLARQKSYSLKLSKGTSWHGLRKINLNKCPYDLTRLRDKLSFDLLAGLPESASLQTRFVQLTLDGRDFGLFTQIEEPNKVFMKAHGLDPQGSLYKAQRFDFNRKSQVFKLKTDPGYDAVRFERQLTIHGNDDHGALIAMLDDVNNPELPIDQVIDRDFDRGNYLTWLAVNILMQNLDTNEQNFYLYRARDSQHWLFLPWDYDGAWGWYDQPGAMKPGDPNLPARWQLTGVGNWWGVPLHRRFLEQPENLAALGERVDSLASQFFTHERLAALLQGAMPVVQAAVSRPPDREGLPTKEPSLAAWKREVERLYTIVPQQQKRFHETLDWPMPFFLGQVQALGSRHTFNWNASYSLVGHPLSYDFTLGRRPGLAAGDRLVQRSGLAQTSLTLDTPLAPGSYYWQVIARDRQDPSRAWQIAFDKLTTDGRGYPGVGELIVP